MRFWDSSAIVPLIVEEPSSESCRDLLRTDSGIIVWSLTRLEIVSALRRKQREQNVSPEHFRSAIQRLDSVQRAWSEVDAVEPVTRRAERLLGTHVLRAADALQLAAALIISQERTAGFEFVTRDKQLFRAIDAEGFMPICPD